MLFRNSISAEIPSNTTILPNANFTREVNVTEVTLHHNGHFNVSSNDNALSDEFEQGPIDFAEPLDENETWIWITGIIDFQSTTTSTSTSLPTTSVTSSSSTMSTTTSSTSTISTTETSTTKEFFIARNQANSVLKESRPPRSNAQLNDPSRHDKIMFYKYRESEEAAREYAFYLYYEYDFGGFSKNH